MKTRYITNRITTVTTAPKRAPGRPLKATAPKAPASDFKPSLELIGPADDPICLIDGWVTRAQAEAIKVLLGIAA